MVACWFFGEGIFYLFCGIAAMPHVLAMQGATPRWLYEGAVRHGPQLVALLFLKDFDLPPPGIGPGVAHHLLQHGIGRSHQSLHDLRGQ